MENRCMETSHSLTYAYLLKKYGLVISWGEAAAETGVYWENIRRMCARGDIAAEKVGKSWMLTTKALADYIDHNHGAASKNKVTEIPQKQKRGFRKYVSPGISGKEA